MVHSNFAVAVVFASLLAFTWCLDAKGQTPDPCVDLGDLACRDQGSDDGTGAVDLYKSRGLELNPLGEAFRDIEPDLVKGSKNFILDAKNSDLRAKFMRLHGLDQANYCRNKTQRAACKAAVVSHFRDYTVGLLVVQPDDASPSLLESAAAFFSDTYAVQKGVRDSAMFQRLHDQLYKAKQVVSTKKYISEKLAPQLIIELKTLIKKFPAKDSERQKMLTLIDGIKFDDSLCEKVSAGISARFSPNAFLEYPKLSICDGLLRKVNSEFALAAVLSHEMAHAIGLLNWPLHGLKRPDLGNSTDCEQVHPLLSLITCLRGANSVGAKKVNEPFRAPCISDQAEEAMADFIAAEVTSAYMSKAKPTLTKENWINGASNALRFVCNGLEDPNSMHPQHKARIEGTVLMNPTFREKMGCPEIHPRLKYCGENITKNNTPKSEVAK